MKLAAFLLCLATHNLAAPNALKSGASTRIVGGADAERGQFPYSASYQRVFQTEDNEEIWLHVCGGSIVNENWIVTAGLCFSTGDLDQFRVVAGILNLDDGDEIETKEVRGIKRHIVHENFSNEGGGSPNDIALLELTEPLVWNDAVRPIPLAECGAETEGYVVLSGWGSTAPLLDPDTSNTLQTATVTIIRNSVCKQVLDGVFGTDADPYDEDSNICTGPLNSGVGACVGDNGGPLTADGALVGINSWGFVPCGTQGLPSIYTKVSNFCEWIEEKIGS